MISVRCIRDIVYRNNPDFICFISDFSFGSNRLFFMNTAQNSRNRSLSVNNGIAAIDSKEHSTTANSSVVKGKFNCNRPLGLGCSFPSADLRAASAALRSSPVLVLMVSDFRRRRLPCKASGKLAGHRKDLLSDRVEPGSVFECVRKSL